MTTDLERLLEPGCTDSPECRCGKEMHMAHVVFVPNVTETHIRVYACAECDHQMRLTVWGNGEALDGTPAAFSESNTSPSSVT
jgi:hypothetical protein